jgi:hypothetical protein
MDGIGIGKQIPYSRESVWYHDHLEYDAIAETVRLLVTRSSAKGGDGSIVADLLLENISGNARLASNVNRLGMSGKGDWEGGGRTTEYYVDNINLYICNSALKFKL